MRVIESEAQTLLKQYALPPSITSWPQVSLLLFSQMILLPGFPAGFRSTRRTKIICTIGPNSSTPEMLQTLAESGMNVARLNMGHGTREWHKDLIDRIRKLNRDKGQATLNHNA